MTSTMHTSAKTTVELECNLNSDLEHINNWCLRNKMCPNTEKTKCMLVTTRQKRSHLTSSALNVKIGDNNIENVDSEKLLGVTIQSDLSWASHVQSIVKKIKCKLYLLARIRPFLPVSARRQFYNSFILPYFDYCLSIWGCCSQKEMDHLNCLLIAMSNTPEYFSAD